MIKLLMILILLSNVLNAHEMSSKEFSNHISLLRSQISTSAVNDFALHSHTKDLITQLTTIERIRTQHRDYYIDLEWVADVIANYSKENQRAKRETLLMNMVDTLEGLANEIEYAGAFSGVSRHEMNAALQRAIARTVKVRITRQSFADREISHTTRGGYVMEGAGEQVKLSKAEAVDQSGKPLKSTQGSSSSASSKAHSQLQSISQHKGAQSATQNVDTAIKQLKQTRQHSSQQDQAEHRQHTPNVQITKQMQHQSSQISRPKPPKPPAPTKPPPPLPKKKPLNTPKPPAAAGLFFYLFIGMAIIGFMMVVGIIIYKVMTKVKEEQEKELLGMRKDELPPEQLTTDSLLDKAMQAAAKENYHEAIKLLTIGALIILEHQQIISYKDSLTNGEYLKKLLVEKELHAKFKKPMRVFDKLIYGFQQPDRKDFFMFRDFYLDLEKMQR